MALVDSQDCNREARGCARRSFFVCFWYKFRAAWKIVWKEEGCSADDGVWDMTGDCDDRRT